MTPGTSQYDGDACQSFNCWAGTGARLTNFAKGTGYGAGYFHKLVDSKCRAGGSSDIVKGLTDRGVEAQVTGPVGGSYTANDALAELKDRCANGEAAGLVGDYDALKGTAFDVAKGFTGDHWVSVDHYDPKADTFNWADPTRRPTGFVPSRIPTALLRRYWIDVRHPIPGQPALVKGRAVFVRGPDYVEDYMIVEDEKQNLVLPEGTPFFRAVNDATPLGSISVPTPNGVSCGSIDRAGWRAIRVRTAAVLGGPVWAFTRTGVGSFVPKPAPAAGGGFTQKDIDAAVAAKAAEDELAKAAAIAENTSDLKARALLGVTTAVSEAIGAI